MKERDEERRADDRPQDRERLSAQAKHERFAQVELKRNQRPAAGVGIPRPPGTCREDAINSETANVEDRVEATLAEAVSVGGAEVLPAGSTLDGIVTAVEGLGKVKGLASIRVHFTRLAAAGVGAAIGGLLGGKSGAAKGAVIGGGGGTAVVLSTKGKEVERAAGARLTVRLERSVEVRVPIG